MKRKTENYYIAYFDILGYKDFFANKDNDLNEFLEFNISLVNDILDGAKRNTIIFNHPFTVRMFSDNFMILVKRMDR